VSNLIVKKVAVLGAGVMGAQIAAHCVNAKVPVVLFDLPAKQGPKSGIALGAIENLKKLNPAPLGNKDDAAYIEPANYDDDIDRLKECDLIIEAIAERMDWKHDLYRRVAPFIAPHAIFASNTSGLSISALSEGFDAALKARFAGVHFFNPPRYMHLVELIPTPTTKPEILDSLETFLTTVLGKGVVRALDTPNFVANRVGTFGILATIAEAEKLGLPIDVVDDLTGSKLGRAKSATFRTADIVGLDTLHHVIKTMQDNLTSDPFHSLYATPKVLTKLIEQKSLGQKSGAGFYKKVGKDILRFDPEKGDYVPSGAKADDAIVRILKKKDIAERLKLLRESQSPQGQFLWAIFRDVFQYAAVHLDSIAKTARDVDLALRWGFGWSTGPFEVWQKAGWAEVASWIEQDIASKKSLSDAPLPKWVFEGKVKEAGGVHTPHGSYAPASDTFLPRSDLPVYRRQVIRPTLLGENAPTGATAGTTFFEDDSVRVWTTGDPGKSPTGDKEVLILSIKTKMHAISPGVTAGIHMAVDEAEKNYGGLVIWSADEPFSVGADLQGMMPLFASGGVEALEGVEKSLQDAMLRLRYAGVPTIAAVSGMALGGGCELAIACTKRVAHLESYIGLVEVGVGLVPGAGGLMFGARRAAEERAGLPDTPLLQFLKKYFMNAAMANVSKSALEAKQMGYLLPSDTIVFNVHELLGAAIREAKTMFEAGYRPPFKVKGFPVAGRTGTATIVAQLVNLRDGGFISAHDFHLGKTIAEVMCGGEVEPGTLVDEAWLLALERKAFMSLLMHPKSQERIVGMMTDGKPVRN
jgi:3-hydroxyacyl-CoA dehydrogenase